MLDDSEDYKHITSCHRLASVILQLQLMSCHQLENQLHLLRTLIDQADTCRVSFCFAFFSVITVWWPLCSYSCPKCCCRSSTDNTEKLLHQKEEEVLCINNDDDDDYYCYNIERSSVVNSCENNNARLVASFSGQPGQKGKPFWILLEQEMMEWQW